MEKQDYTVTNEGWVDGVWRAKDETLSLTPREAEHLEAGGVIRKADKAETRPARAKPADGAEA